MKAQKWVDNMWVCRSRALGGWRRDSGGEEASYGSGLKASTLYREIKKLRYEGLNFRHPHSL